MAEDTSDGTGSPYRLSMSAAAVEANQQAMEAVDNDIAELFVKVNEGDVFSVFPLAQILFMQRRFDETKDVLEKASPEDYRSKFLLATLMFDGLGGFELSKENQIVAFEIMKEVAASPLKNDPFVFSACYNVGSCYFLGVAVKNNSIEDAELWWNKGADDGNPEASIRSQTALGMFYSRVGSAQLDKAFYWHSEALANGSLESQAAIGVMYDRGLGTTRNEEAAFDCLRTASTRGSCFATGYLSAMYYKRRLYVKCVELAVRCLETYGGIDFSDPVWEQEAALAASATARRGLAMAAFFLSRCLQLGKGVRSDEPRSKHYLKKAIEYDSDMATQLMIDAQNGRN